MKKLLTIFIILLFAAVAFADSDSHVAVSNPIGQVAQVIDYDDFTDSGATSGTLSLTNTIPAGAIPIAWRAVVSTAFAGTGVSTVNLQAGVSGDVDRFSASDGQSIAAAATVGDSALGEAIGCDGMASAQTILLTVTEDDDFTDITGGTLTFYMYYIRP